MAKQHDNFNRKKRQTAIWNRVDIKGLALEIWRQTELANQYNETKLCVLLKIDDNSCTLYDNSFMMIP